jgi:LacI family transcriptional regulator
MKERSFTGGEVVLPPGRIQGSVTIEMVAQLAGVSAATVSRILNGSAVVSEAKRKSVDQAVAQLGFVPNPIARGLAGGKTLTIGVLTQAVDSPFYGPALRGIEDALDPEGYRSLFVSGHWEPRTEERCIETLLSRRVDGIIVLTGRLSDGALIDCAKSVPVVVTGRDLKAPRLFAFNFDNEEGGRLATSYLIEQGHRDVAFVSGDPLHPDAVQRLSGYKLALERAYIPFRPELVIQGDYTEQSGVQAIAKLLDAKLNFTAVFSANDQMAVGVAHGLMHRGLRIPDDVSLIGFDDLPASRFAFPPLTTVRQPAYELGRIAGVAMLNLLAGTSPDLQVPEPSLICRDSCICVVR